MASQLANSTSLKRRSPLDRFWEQGKPATLSAGQTQVAEQPFMGLIKLQCRESTAAFFAEMKQVLNLDLPTEPNRRVGDELSCFWVAPNEWLILTSAGEDEALAETLQQHVAKALPDENIAITLVTDSRVALRVFGKDSANLLAKGCSIDFHPNKFSYGQSAVTLLEQVTVMICAEREPLSYLLFVDRSYAAFVWAWLEHGLQEFKN